MNCIAVMKDLLAEGRAGGFDSRVDRMESGGEIACSVAVHCQETRMMERTQRQYERSTEAVMTVGEYLRPHQ